MPESGSFGVGELAALGGVSRRTVRYYIQEALLPAPFGLGRGARYGKEHLERLLKVRGLQEAGRSLDEVRQALRGPERRRPAAVSAPRRELLCRVEMAPGVELVVDGRLRLPSPGKLAELAAWCRANFPEAEGEDDDERG